MAREIENNWQHQPLSNEEKARQDFLGWDFLLNRPTAFNVSNSALIQAYENRDKRIPLQAQIEDNLLQWTSPLGAYFGPIGMGITSLLGSVESAKNARENRYWNTYKTLVESLGRKPTQNEFNTAFEAQSVLPEAKAATVDALFSLVPASKINLVRKSSLGLHRPDLTKAYAAEILGNILQ